MRHICQKRSLCLIRLIGTLSLLIQLFHHMYTFRNIMNNNNISDNILIIIINLIYTDTADIMILYTPGFHTVLYSSETEHIPVQFKNLIHPKLTAFLCTHLQKYRCAIINDTQPFCLIKQKYRLIYGIVYKLGHILQIHLKFLIIKICLENSKYSYKLPKCTARKRCNAKHRHDSIQNTSQGHDNNTHNQIVGQNTLSFTDAFTQHINNKQQQVKRYYHAIERIKATPPAVTHPV